MVAADVIMRNISHRKKYVKFLPGRRKVEGIMMKETYALLIKIHKGCEALP